MKCKRRRLGRGGGDPEDARPEIPLAPSPPSGATTSGAGRRGSSRAWRARGGWRGGEKRGGSGVRRPRRPARARRHALREARALAAVVCRVLGWDIERLPSIVMDPRGTLVQALAARAQSDAREVKEDVETEIKGWNPNGDEVTNELETSKESAGKDVKEIGPLNCKDSSKTNVHSHLTNQEDTVNTRMEETIRIDGEKETTELHGGKESFEKDNANKDDSLRQDNNGVVQEQDISTEATENVVGVRESKNECTKTADDVVDVVVTRSGNISLMGENVENK